MGYGKQASDRNREPLMPFTAAYLKCSTGNRGSAITEQKPWPSPALTQSTCPISNHGYRK